MGWLSEIFTWWNGQTLGTRLMTARHGVRVGADDQGNVFYRTADDKRRWVIYQGVSEASRVSPDWHGWLHRTFDKPPTEAPLPRKAWERDHAPNPTGTGDAHVPPGSALGSGARPRVVGDYEPWTPE